jgi:acyl dehydratase
VIEASMSTTESPSVGLSTTMAELHGHSGKHLGSTAWRTLTQGQVNAFADLTEDHNPIHVDLGHAAGTPFGGTIVHGYFTVSLLAPLLEELLHVDGAALSVNYGIDKLRFPAPVPVGARFRASAELAEVTEIASGVQIRVVATVEVENSPKPALVAECLFRHYA